MMIDHGKKGRALAWLAASSHVPCAQGNSTRNQDKPTAPFSFTRWQGVHTKYNHPINHVTHQYE